MSLAMRSVTIGIDALEEPKDNKELRKLTIEHIEDYIFNPSPEKSFVKILFLRSSDICPHWSDLSP